MAFESWRRGGGGGLPPESKGPRINVAPAAVLEREGEAKRQKTSRFDFGRFWDVTSEMSKSALEHLNRGNIEKFLKEKKVLGKSAWAISMTLVGSGSATAVRWAGRYAAWSLSFGSFGAGIASGAVAGAAVEGFRAWRKEVNRDVGVEEMRERAEKITKEELKRKIDAYCAVAERETISAEDSNRNKLYHEAKNALGVRKMEIVKGIAKGAAIGAIGGFIGWRAAEWLSGFVQSAASEAGGAAAKAAAAAAKEKINTAANEAYRAAFDKAIKSGIGALDSQTFTATVSEGEGLTHATRKLVHDYLLQKNELGKLVGYELSLNRAELIYAEDYVRKALGGERVLALGESLKASGKLIQDAVSEAQSLSARDVANLDKNWVGNVSEKTWGKISIPTLLSESNSHVEGIVNDAIARATQEARSAALDASRQAASAGRDAAVVLAKDGWLGAFWDRYGGKTTKGVLYALGIGGTAGALGYKYQDQLKRGGRWAVEKGGKVSARALKWESLKLPQMPSFGVLPKGFSFSEKFSGLRSYLQKRREQREEKRAAAPATEEAKKSLLHRVRERAAEVARGARDRIQVRASKKDRERFQCDPVARALMEQGIDVPWGNLWYYAPRPKDLKKGREPRIHEFADYSSYRKHWDKLTKEEKLLSMESGECGVGFEESIVEAVENNKELAEQIRELEERAVRGLLADDYAKLPEQADELAAYEREREEELRKLELDPFNRLFEAEGVYLLPDERVWYRAPDMKSIDPDTGAAEKVLQFSTYSDFRKYLDALSPKERREAKRFEFEQGAGGESKRVLGIWVSKKLQKRLQENPDLAEKFDALVEKAHDGLLADQYLNLPEREAITHERVREFAKEVVSEESPHFYSDFLVWEGEYEKLETLRNNPELARLLRESGINSFSFGDRNTLEYFKGLQSRVVLNTEGPVSEIRDFLLGISGKREEFYRRIDNVNTKNDAINDTLTQRGIDARFILETLSFDELEGQSRMLDTLKNVFDAADFPFDALAQVDFLHMGSGGASVFGRWANIFIPADLSVQEMREFILQEAEKAKTLKRENES